MPRGRLALAVALTTLAVAPSAAGASWADAQIRTVVERGLMGPSVEVFRPKTPLTRRELGEALAALTGQAQVVVDPARAATVSELHAGLVRALGLRPAALAIRGTLTQAGLYPPRRVGTETVARLLRLRLNHAPSRDTREQLPDDPVSRAEAAYSLARVLELGEEDIAYVNELASFALPTPRPWEARVLRRALRFVGYPYVWGGTSELAHAPFGRRVRGGFDCSGFTWRVYKLEAFAGGGALADTLRGRTTYEMSGEVPASARIAFGRLRPADVVFFGERGPRSRPAAIGHMGIYLGGGWFIHSSGQGVTLVPLADGYRERFAWGRRPLREAGLS